MSTTMSDHQLATRVARELSSPEPGMHFGLTLVVGTLIAAPILLSAVFGSQPVPTALAIYGLTLVVVWIVVGLVGGAFAMFGSQRIGADGDGADGSSSDHDAADAPSSPTASGPVGEGPPHPGPGSVGSNSAH